MRKSLFILCSIVTGYTSAQSLQDAVRYIENEKYSRAKTTLFNIVKSAPKADAYYQLGNVYLKLENADSALFYFNKSKEVDPKYNLALVGVGSALFQKGKKAEAKTNFDQAIALTKNKNAEVLARIAEVYVESKDKKEAPNAVALADKAVTLSKTVPEYYLIRGDAHLLNQNGSKAAADYTEAARLNPKYAEAYIKHGKLLGKARNYDEALKYYNKGIEADPDYSPAYREKGELYARAKQYPKAIESYKKYMELSDNDDDTKYRYASFLFMTQDYKGSQDLINELFAKGFTNKVAFRLLGYSAYELGDSVAALSNMEQFFKLTDSTKYIPSDYTYYGKALVKNGRVPEGMNYMVKSYELDTTNNDILLEIAELANKQKDYPTAITYYEKALKKFKPRFNDLYNLGRAYYFEKRYPEADTTFGTIIVNYPKYPYGYTWKANTKATLDPDSKKGLAKPYFEKVIELFSAESAKYKSDLIKAHNYLGAYYQLVAKNNTKAEQHWNKLLELDPNNQQAKDAITILKNPNSGKK